jgi:hypothetical protein
MHKRLAPLSLWELVPIPTTDKNKCRRFVWHLLTKLNSKMKNLKDNKQLQQLLLKSRQGYHKTFL